MTPPDTNPHWRDRLILRATEAHDVAMNSIPDTLPPGGWSQALTAELLMVAKRTLTSVTALMNATFGGNRDHTEDAAALLRKLLELNALVFYVTSMGDDPEVQALRIELKEARSQRDSQARLLASGDFAHQSTVEISRTFVEQIESELIARIGSARPQGPLTDIMKAMDPRMLYRWQFESSVAHGGIRGRGLQRAGTTLGTDAHSTRQADVLIMAALCFIETASAVVGFLGYDLTRIETWMQEFYDEIDELKTSAHAEGP